LCQGAKHTGAGVVPIHFHPNLDTGRSQHRPESKPHVGFRRRYARVSFTRWQHTAGRRLRFRHSAYFLGSRFA
jgi:hypothetical protein